MPVIRKNQRDERRRRALVDDAKPNTQDTSSRQSTARKSTPQNSYSDAALVCNQPRITDFIPTRLFSVWVILLIGLTLCCANATAALVYFDRFQIRFPEFQRLFTPYFPGSFASWNASVVLLLATVIATLTLWIRRHRIDDYRGRYRIWFFIPVFLAFTSINAVVWITKISVFDAAEIQLGFATAKVSHLLICFFGIAVGVRLLLEIRPSKAATTLLLSAGASYMLSYLVNWNAFGVFAGLTEFVSSLTMLVGHWLLSMSLLTNLRFIFLDAQGEIVAMQNRRSQLKIQAKKNKEAAAQAKAEAVAAKKASSTPADKIEEPAVVPLKKAAIPEKPSKQAAATTTQAKSETRQQKAPQGVETEGDDQNNSAMSRAERKRLRKEKKKHRRAA